MDFEQIKEYAAVLRESRLSEIEVRVGGASLRLRRHFALPPAAVALENTRPAAAARTDATAVGDNIGSSRAQGASSPTAAAGATALPLPDVVVTAFLVGIFRCSEPPILLGDVLTEKQTFGQIESLRLLNECTAPVTGRVTAVYVEDGQPVEYGQPLIQLTPEKAE